MKEIIPNNIKRKILRSDIYREPYMDGVDDGRTCYEIRLKETKEVAIKVVVRDNPYWTNKHQAIPWEIELFQYEKNIPEEEISCFLNWLYQQMEFWDDDRFNYVIACFYCVGGDESYIVRYFNMQPIGKKNGHTVYCWRREFTPNLK